MALEQLEQKVNDLAREVAELRREIRPLRPLRSPLDATVVSLQALSL